MFNLNPDPDPEYFKFRIRIRIHNLAINHSKLHSTQMNKLDIKISYRVAMLCLKYFIFS